jgi:hypothetical protein
MAVALFILSGLALFVAASIAVGATTIFHQMAASIAFLTAAALFGSAGIVYAVDHLRKAITEDGRDTSRARVKRSLLDRALGE